MPRKRKIETVAQLAKKKLDAMWERAVQMQMPKKDNSQEIILKPPKKKELTPDQQKKKEYAHNYYMAHREECLERTKKWQREHREIANKAANDYYHRNSKRLNKIAYDKLRNNEEKWEQKKAQQRERNRRLKKSTRIAASADGSKSASRKKANGCARRAVATI